MMLGSQIIIVPIIYNNPIKACFSNKTYSVSIQIRMIQIENNICISYWNPRFNRILKIISLQNKFKSDLVQLWYVLRYESLEILHLRLITNL